MRSNSQCSFLRDSAEYSLLRRRTDLTEEQISPRTHHGQGRRSMTSHHDYELAICSPCTLKILKLESHNSSPSGFPPTTFPIRGTACRRRLPRPSASQSGTSLDHPLSMSIFLPTVNIHSRPAVAIFRSSASPSSLRVLRPAA